MQVDRLGRMLKVADFLIEQPSGSSLSDISRNLGIPLSSTHDLMNGLVELDVARQRDRVYVLGPRMVKLGIRANESLTVRTIGHQHLADLAQQLTMDVYIAANVGGSVVYTDRYASRSQVKVNVGLGRRLHLHCTAAGKLMAAFDETLQREALTQESYPALTAHTLTTRRDLEAELRRVVRLGYAVSNQESFVGVAGFAVPVWGPDQRICAALHVSTLSAELTPAHIDPVTEAMRRTAEAIKTDLSASSMG